MLFGVSRLLFFLLFLFKTVVFYFRQAPVQHKAVENVHGLLQLPTGSGHRGREDILHARRTQPGTERHGPDQARAAPHGRARHRCGTVRDGRRYIVHSILLVVTPRIMIFFLSLGASLVDTRVMCETLFSCVSGGTARSVYGTLFVPARPERGILVLRSCNRNVLLECPLLPTELGFVGL